ncbi:MAG: glutamate-5-semialdehyde dehydrogenase [Clostridiales bacterium]|jgi:glutamate-5-semialdehyde dehydrogenase|nr:glutamate-5-semialdehyde dehydrogenase [Clostridiales bacterium]
MTDLKRIGERAKAAARQCSKLGTNKKNAMLAAAAEYLRRGAEYILAENKKDLEAAAGLTEALRDRLTLNPARLEAMADGLLQVAALPDPVGEGLMMKTLPNGLTVNQVRVPMGVIGIIYEARPNVTSDAAALCVKSGNAVILRGGKEAINTNKAVVARLREAFAPYGPEDAVQLIEDVSRETAAEFMKLNKYVDVLIPRGGEGLIRTVVENSTIPVIETGTGNCHIFVDESADLEAALSVVLNAKTQRPGVCNACEKLLVHQRVAPEFLPAVCGALAAKKVEIRGDRRAASVVSSVVPAVEEDWGREYLELIIAVKIVDSLDEAIEHIAKYSSGHSEAIITADYENARRFAQEVDSAAVYVNASTRFTDGFEFGFGAEIGISTQKLHARGPMGLRELTSTKYIVLGSGQIREM